jgi:hypothetical protein
MPSTTGDYEFVRERAGKAARDEEARLQARAFWREATVAALLCCFVGLIGLAVCVIGDFDLRVATGATPVTSVEGRVHSVYFPVHDLTIIFLGVAAAGFASALVVTGSVLGHLSSMPVSASYPVLVAGGLSTIGLLLLAAQV